MAVTACAVVLLFSARAWADSSQVISLPLEQRSSGTFYIEGVFGTGVATSLLVDTGSSYVVLSEKTFADLKKNEAATFLRTIRGATASGRVHEASVYSIAALTLAGECVIHDVEAVVLPGSDRDILGLSALRRLESLALDFSPPMLNASACDSVSAATLAAK